VCEVHPSPGHPGSLVSTSVVRSVIKVRNKVPSRMLQIQRKFSVTQWQYPETRSTKTPLAEVRSVVGTGASERRYLALRLHGRNVPAR